MNENPTLPEKLIIAVSEANQAVKDLAAHKLAGRKVNNDHGWEQRYRDITEVELPERMGRLISGLDILDAYQSLNTYVRSFEDAETVLKTLKDTIAGKVSENNRKAVDEFIFMCHEMPRTVAELIVDPVGNINT